MKANPLRYEDLSESLKEVAREFRPLDYENWYYHVQGVEIPWCAGPIKKS